MQRHLESHPLPSGEFLWHHDLRTGGLRGRTYVALENLQRLILRCQDKLDVRRSFEVLRVEKVTSGRALSMPHLSPPSLPPTGLPITEQGGTMATGPFMIRQKPVARSSPAAPPAPPAPSHGQTGLVPSCHDPHPQPATLVTSERGEIGEEYHSIHHRPRSACPPRWLQSPTQASLSRPGPRAQQVGGESRASTRDYSPFQPGSNGDRPREHVRPTAGTNSHTPAPRWTMPAPRVSEQGRAGPDPVTVPQLPSRARARAPSSLPISTRYLQGQGTLAGPPARATTPQITITAPTPRTCSSGPAAARDDDRLTLPTYKREWKRRGAAALTTQSKIASGTRHEVTRRAAAVSSRQPPLLPRPQQQRQQQALRKRPGSRSLREVAAGEGYMAGGSPLARHA